MMHDEFGPRWFTDEQLAALAELCVRCSPDVAFRRLEDGTSVLTCTFSFAMADTARMLEVLGEQAKELRATLTDTE